MKSWKARTEIFLCVLIAQMGLSICLAHDNTTIHPKNQSAFGSSFATAAMISSAICW